MGTKYVSDSFVNFIVIYSLLHIMLDFCMTLRSYRIYIYGLVHIISVFYMAPRSYCSYRMR